MNRLLLLGLMLASVSGAALIYTVDTDRSGFSSVTLSMQGGGAVQVTLPQDASDFRIVGGSYQIINGTAIVNPGTSGFTTFSFTSSLFTGKTTDGWKLSFDPPDGATVDVYMPLYSNIDNPFPAPKSISADSSRTLIEFDNPQLVTIYYRLGQPPAAQQSDSSSLYMMIALALVAVAIISAAVILKMPNRVQTILQAPPAQPGPAGPQPPSTTHANTSSLEITRGKKEMMETFNENDLKIVNYLTSVQGKSRRNELERKTGISKSSLAMAINRLEKRKIIEIDRTSTTHFVKLSEYFLRL